MKLPFHNILGFLLKPQLGRTRSFCQHPTFAISIFYTYFYGALGLLISANHLKQHLGEIPHTTTTSTGRVKDLNPNFMLVHDLKIIATSMGVVQYACLLVGCFTENPSLFLPHLAGQLIVVLVKILNALLSLASIKGQPGRLVHKVFAIMLMTFNWFQEFCVFRQYLCICDL